MSSPQGAPEQNGNHWRQTEDFAIIDLFAGSGAFTLGLRQAGISGPALLVDRAPDCVETCRVNLSDVEVVEDDVAEFDWTGLSARVVVGGPPCQGFSSLGLRDVDDPRNRLFRALLRCVEHVEPEVVVVENVAGFLKSVQGDSLLDRLVYLGYSVRAEVVDCVSYGVPQTRRRALVVATPNGSPVLWPAAKYGKNGLPVRTVADAFAMLPRTPDGRNWHRAWNVSPAYEERIRSIPPGGSRVDLPADLVLDCWQKASGHSDVMGRLRWTSPANTLRTEFFRPEKGRFLHPTEDRPITIREGARIQGFPDSFCFPEAMQSYPVARQIGNAIPPPLAKAIGTAIGRNAAVQPATHSASVREAV
jgi:DNA (cytosine-5)-methyltransferase 1